MSILALGGMKGVSVTGQHNTAGTDRGLWAKVAQQPQYTQVNERDINDEQVKDKSLPDNGIDSCRETEPYLPRCC
jgi:hypothetical protein